MVWAFVVSVMMVIALVSAAVLVGVTELSVAAVGAIGAVLFLVEGLIFLGVVLLNTRQGNGRVRQTQNLHDYKLLRHENNLLKKTIQRYENMIRQLERELAHQTALAERSGHVQVAQTGLHPRIETREVNQITGEYQVVNTPTYTPRQGPHSTDTGVYPTQRGTGEHPLVKSGRIPRSRPNRPPPY